MKNRYFLIALILIPAFSFGQSKVENDTLYYLSYKFAKGDTIQLSYGSNPKKDFAFVFMGSGMSGVTPLETKWAKSFVVADKVYSVQGKSWIRGKVTNSSVNLIGSNKVFIDIEGAIDFKELKLE